MTTWNPFDNWLEKNGFKVEEGNDPIQIAKLVEEVVSATELGE